MEPTLSRAAIGLLDPIAIATFIGGLVLLGTLLYVTFVDRGPDSW